MAASISSSFLEDSLPSTSKKSEATKLVVVSSFFPYSNEPDRRVMDPQKKKRLCQLEESEKEKNRQVVIRVRNHIYYL